MTVGNDAPKDAEDPTVRALAEFPDLPRQAAPEPRYSRSDVALLHGRLEFFEAVVDSALREMDSLPESSRQRAKHKRQLMADRTKLCDTVRFSVRCGLPVWPEMDRLDQIERQLLAYFPDAAPCITRN